MSKNNARSKGVEDCYSRYDDSPLLSLTPCSAEALEDMWYMLGKQGCTVIGEAELALPTGGGCADAVAVCEKAAASVMHGYFGKTATIVTPDTGAYYREMSGTAQPYVEIAALDGSAPSSDFYSDWRDLDARMAHVEAAVQASGGAATLETAGFTLSERPIKAVRFTGKGYKSGMPKVVMNFNVHAREWIAGMAGVYAVEMLAAKAKADPEFLAGVEVVMVPMLNPDGFVQTQSKDRFHRKNMQPGTGWWPCNGADVNRNAEVAFGGSGASTNQCSDTYMGASAMSELETQAISKLMNEAPMTVYFDVHSYTQLILSAWSYTRSDHPRKEEYASLGEKIKAAIEGKHGQSYTLGPGAQTLYTASGTLGDYADSLGALGYIIELRPKNNDGLKGFAPPATEIVPTSEECYEGILAAITHAKAS